MTMPVIGTPLPGVKVTMPNTHEYPLEPGHKKPFGFPIKPKGPRTT